MFSHTDLDVLHVLKEVRLRVAVIGELYQVSKFFLGGKRLDQAGQDGGVLMLHTLEERTGTFIMLSGATEGASGCLGDESLCSHLSFAAKPFNDSVQDGVLHDVLVDLFSGLHGHQLGDYSRQTKGGVVSQRHVTDLEVRGRGRGVVRTPLGL